MKQNDVRTSRSLWFSPYTSLCHLWLKSSSFDSLRFSAENLVNLAEKDHQVQDSVKFKFSHTKWVLVIVFISVTQWNKRRLRLDEMKTVPNWTSYWTYTRHFDKWTKRWWTEDRSVSHLSLSLSKLQTILMM